MDYNSYRFIGYIGLPLYFCFLVFCIYKLVHFLRYPEPANFKYHFYGALIISFFFDEIYYSSLIFLDRESGWGYPMHMIALLFNMVAFSQVILFWSRTLHFGGEYQDVCKVVFKVVMLNAVFVFIGSIIMFVGSYANIFACIVALVYGFSLLLFASWMLKYGLQLRLRLSNQQQQRALQQSDTSKRIFELLRINFVLVVCIFFYTFRAIVLIMIFLWNMNIIPERHGSAFDLLLWYVFSLWIPQLLPDTLLMYLMRAQGDVYKQKNSMSNGVQLKDGADVAIKRDSDAEYEEHDRENWFSDISLGRSSSVDKFGKESHNEEIYSSFNPARLLSVDGVGAGSFSDRYSTGQERQSGVGNNRGTGTSQHKSITSTGNMMSWLFASKQNGADVSDMASDVSAAAEEREQRQESDDDNHNGRRSMDIF